MIGRSEASRCVHDRAKAVAASEVDARALAREMARAGAVTLERDLLLELLSIARRGVRSDADAEVIGDVQLIARTERTP